MRYLLLIIMTLTLIMTSCGNVKDSDGKIGNEGAESTNTENIKDKAEDMMDDASDAASDIADDASEAAERLKDAMSEGVTVGRLTTEQAQSAALMDAGCASRDVTFYKTYLHNDDGRVFYDVEFATSEAMYEYEIDSVTGSVLKREESVIR